MLLLSHPPERREKIPESLVSIYFESAMVILCRKNERVLDTTGHRMVLECAIAALKRMNQPAIITIHTDCHYFADGQRRLSAWKDNGWKRSDGKELRNLDLWQQLEELLRPHAVSFQMENMELYKNPDETPWS